jgi:hypothetical protein
LKTAFNIPVNTESLEQPHLLIEVGSYGISILWVTKKPLTLKGLLVNNFETGDIPIDKIKSILDSPQLASANPSSVIVSYNVKESLLVPDSFYQSEIAGNLIDLVYGEAADTYIKAEPVVESGLHNSYRIEADMEKIFKDFFPGTRFIHSTSLQLPGQMEGNRLMCIIFHNCIKLIFHKEGELQLVQQFNYNKPDDVLYHLLNTCELHGLPPEKVALVLCGMIDEGSQLYKRLYNYFTYIAFMELPANIVLAKDVSGLPAHFFSHLTSLAVCVL